MCGCPSFLVRGRRTHEVQGRTDEWGFPEMVSEVREWKFHDRQAAIEWADRMIEQQFFSVVLDVSKGMKVHETWSLNWGLQPAAG